MLLLLCRITLGFAEGLGLPMMFQIFAKNVPVHQRSRAFSYLISAGTVGQTFAAILTPHFYWPVMFYSFGSIGLVWCLFWTRFYYRSAFDGQILPTKITDGSLDGSDTETLFVQNNKNGKAVQEPWIQYWQRWPLWAIYIAHFAMNWSSYIIMIWLPYYLHKYLQADEKSLSLTALPYVMNSIAGICKFALFLCPYLTFF